MMWKRLKWVGVFGCALLMSSFATPGYGQSNGNSYYYNTETCGVRSDIYSMVLHDIAAHQKDKARLSALKDILNRLAFSTNQAVEILRYFTGNRIEAAALLYENVCDVRNWETVYQSGLFKPNAERMLRERIANASTNSPTYNYDHYPEWYSPSDSSWTYDSSFTFSGDRWWNSQDSQSNKCSSCQTALNQLRATIKREREQFAKERAQWQIERNRLTNQRPSHGNNSYCNDRYDEGFRNGQRQCNCQTQSCDSWYNNGYTNGYNQGIAACNQNTYVPPNNPQYNQYDPCAVAMDDATFNQFLSLIQKESFDGKKINIIQPAINTGAVFTTAQVVSILKTYDFDTNRKVDAVKLYQSVCDKSAWFTVKSTFDFDSSWEEVIKSVGLK